MESTYGVLIQTGEVDHEITECDSLEAAQAVFAGTCAAPPAEALAIELVELEGSGPVFASDGAEIAPTHGPRRTVERWERQRYLCDSDTTDLLGPATAEQIAASDAAGPEGHILIDSGGKVVSDRGPGVRRVYVEA